MRKEAPPSAPPPAFSMVTAATERPAERAVGRCPICFADPIEEPFRTPCSHTFCYTCLRTHLDQHSFCPYPSCRQFCTLQAIMPAFLPAAPAAGAAGAPARAHVYLASPRTPDAPIAAASAPPPPNKRARVSDTPSVVDHSPQNAGGAAVKTEMTPDLTDRQTRCRSPPRITRSSRGAARAERSPGSVRRARAAIEATFTMGSGHGATSTTTGSTPRLAAGVPAIPRTPPPPRPPQSSGSPSIPTDLKALLERDDMDAEQLGMLIAALQEKKRSRGASAKAMRDTLLHDFLRCAREERIEEIRRLQNEVQCLEADLRLSSCNAEAMEKVRAQPAFVTKRRRVDRIFEPLKEHYFGSVMSPNAAGASRSAALQSFSTDLHKITRFGRLRERASLMHAARNASATSNIVSSIEFDRECRLVATAGVTKKIKLFEYREGEGGEHYPVKELEARAKLSWVCWNPYIRSQLVSSDYDGVVSLWDVNRSAPCLDFEEHEKRVWSVDFCTADPRIFASASDDGRVKIWSTAQTHSVCTLGTGSANVCSVKFQPESLFTVAFGSADHSVHLYDMRYPAVAVNVFKGHGRTVSYVKFMSRNELVSACVDSSIRLWSVDDMALVRTYSGHSNDKNFVGLSVTSEMIACGSEENAIFVYYKSVPRPFARFAFPRIDPITGLEVQDDDDRFVSSVCWCPKDDSTLVAANSRGTIKVLRLAEDADEEDDG